MFPVSRISEIIRFANDIDYDYFVSVFQHYSGYATQTKNGTNLQKDCMRSLLHYTHLWYVDEFVYSKSLIKNI